MASSMVDHYSTTNPDTGFGNQPGQFGGRFMNKDGSFNLKKTGAPYFKRASFYSYLLEISWLKFITLVLLFYLVVNLLFAMGYLIIGEDQLQGLVSKGYWSRARELFYFSTQTFTTVGYGRINPIGDSSDLLASIQAMGGWLFFALVTGLLYGRFTRPQAFIDFSEHALIAPYSTGRALMFRLVPYKSNHHLSDVQVVVNLSYVMLKDGKPEYAFFKLGLERSRVDMFNMNWTVVHPIDEQSPLVNFTKEDLEKADVEVLVQVSGFNPIFSNIVMRRTSYTYEEIIWGAKFKPMYHESEDGRTTILELNKLNHYEPVDL
ncbi:MAG TPA: ion channel [Flavisolibacter sp.]|nr:ion channel [Flavisolibacter sp.]